jgi:DsbC/DsbD-like thiol-disulfide interchange protein
MRLLLLLALAAVHAGNSGGRESTHPSQVTETPHLTARPAAGEVTSAGRLSLHVDITPKPKMHVYAPGEKDGIPIEIKLDPNPAIKAGKPVLPPPQKYFFPPLKLTQLVYSSPFRITLPITLARKPSTGTLTITGTLLYQACDDDVCYVPKRLPLKWALKIGGLKSAGFIE